MLGIICYCLPTPLRVNTLVGALFKLMKFSYTSHESSESSSNLNFTLKSSFKDKKSK